LPDDGHLNPREVFAGDDTPSGTTAFLQALMSMLGEVLDRVDGRLASLERTLAAREDPPPVIRPDAGDERVSAALERVSERLERLEAREPEGITTEAAMTRLADLSGSVDDVGRRLAGLADIVTAPSEAEEEWADGLQASMTALGEGLAGLRSQLAAQGSENAGQHNREMTSVLAALEGLGHRLEQLEERDPAKLGLEEAVSRLDDLSTAVDSIGYGMAGIADLVTAPSAPSEGRLELPEGLWAALLALGEGVVELRQDLNVQPVAELRGTVRRLEGQLTLLNRLLASQPGPGAAVAMVAAGLAERFEERTEALTELLGTHAAYVRQTWERIEGILDGGGFDELAVGDALEHVIRNQELMADSVERVIVRIEDLHALPQATGDGLAREALETLGAGMEGVGVRVDDVRRRLAALASALEASSHEVAPDPDASDPATVIGRRATTAGRRLANDLGLRGRGRSPRPPGGDQSPPRR